MHTFPSRRIYTRRYCSNCCCPAPGRKTPSHQDYSGPRRASVRLDSEHEQSRRLAKHYNDRCAYLSLYVSRQSFTTHPVVGLTGGIATGKSTVSNLLRARGVPLVDADLIARQVVEPGTPALAKIQAYFGDGVIQPDGTLDRKKLGTIIFNDEEKRRKLNGIVHPAVRSAMLWQVLGYWVRGNKYCVLDVPLLIEGSLWKMVGKVVVVYWYVVVICIAAFSFLNVRSSIAPSNFNSSDSCSVITHQEKTPPPGSTLNYPSQRKSNTLTSSLTTLERVRSWKRTLTRWCGGWSRMRGGRGGLVGLSRCS